MPPCVAVLVGAVLLAGVALAAPGAAAAGAAAPGSPVVQLEKGAVRGTTLTSRAGRPFSAFLGVPYARPPVGKYRFKSPKPNKPWQGVWDATVLPPKCLQLDRYPISDIVGDEDCLYLNIFTPRMPAPGAPLLDVLVWIHGGGFMYGGSKDWGAEILMDKDVVLVTINYRLGPLGFLSTEDEVVPGNMGMKDQSMALRWLQGNVAAFGGNPNSVTLFGLSAGGASVHYHYLSPLSEGSFHRGWSMSGSALCPWTQQEAGLAKARRLAELVGCFAPAQNASSRDLVDCLRQRPARAVVGAVLGLQDELELPFAPFAPIVEPRGTPGAFVDRPPIDIIRQGLAHDLPWITGITTEEGIYNGGEFLGPARTHRLEQLEKRWLEKAPLLLDYDLTADPAQKDAVSRAAKEAYFGSRPVSEATAKELIAMIGDRTFKAGVEQAAREMSRANSKPVYLYEFGYRGKMSISFYMSGVDANYGVSHADDAGYLLSWEAMVTGSTPAEQKVTKELTTLLTTFAKTGVPSATPGSPSWSPLDPKASDLYILRTDRNAQLSFTTVPSFGKTAFWMAQPLAENVAGSPAAGRDEF